MKFNMSDLAAKAAGNLVSKIDPAQQPGTIWSAVGQPLTRIGAGRYRLTDQFLYAEKGTLSSSAHQHRTHDIYDVDSSQSMQQKARGVGTITLTVRTTDGDRRVQLEDIPNFREGVQAINDAAYQWRLREIDLEVAGNTQRIQQTQNVNYNQAAPVQVVPSAASTPRPAAPAADLNAQLAKLAAFHESGVLDDAEFAAAKKKLLGI